MREVNLIGGFYRDEPFSAQDTVNWLPVQAQAEGTRSPIKLRGAPGLSPLTSSVVPLPEWTTWDAADIVGSGALEDGARTFYGTGATQSTAPNDATTGYKRTRGVHPMVGPAKHYFEAYSNVPTLRFSEWPPLLEQYAIRLGLARKGFSLGPGNSGNDGLMFEAIWKLDAALGPKSGRGQLQTAGVNGMLAGPINQAVSQWVGIAVETTGSLAGVLGVKVWCIIDGNWAYEGENPQNTPAGSTALNGSFGPAESLGGIVPVCSLYNPRTVDPEYVVRANFGQQGFRVGASAFASGGVLEGFTKGWPAP